MTAGVTPRGLIADLVRSVISLPVPRVAQRHVAPSHRPCLAGHRRPAYKRGPFITHCQAAQATARALHPLSLSLSPATFTSQSPSVCTFDHSLGGGAKVSILGFYWTCVNGCDSGHDG